MVHLFKDPEGETTLDVTPSRGASATGTLNYRPTSSVAIAKITNSMDEVAGQRTKLEKCMAEVIICV